MSADEPGRLAPGARVSRIDINGETLVVLAIDRAPPDVPQSLTPAERQVVQLLLEGASTGDIARCRESSVGTVSKHLAAVFRKMDVGSREELVAALQPPDHSITR